MFKQNGESKNKASCMVMVDGWEKYVKAGQSRLFASEWYKLFKKKNKKSEKDFRSSLTWRNRFEDAVSGKLYNFFSSSEDVLRKYDGDSIVAGFFDILKNRYAWVLQEKYKGRSRYPNLGGLASPFMGFGYNKSDYSKWGRLFTPLEAEKIKDKQLKSKPFFSIYNPVMSWGSKAIKNDMKKLLGNKKKANEFIESTVAKTALTEYYTENWRIHTDVTVRDFFLCEAIPATTLPMGANKLDIRAKFNPDSNNFDMPENFMTKKEDWPVKEKIKKKKVSAWHHSAFKEVPYQHTKKLYEKFVELMK